LKILVTGAAGFIGSHLTEALASQGHNVVALDALMEFPYPSQQKINNWNLLGLLGENVVRIKADLRLPIDHIGIQDCDFVFHLAAIPGLNLSWEDTKLYIECNILGTSNLLRACHSASIKNFIYVSTSSVYGKNVFGDETSELIPVSPYGVTKLAAENLISAYCKAFDMPFSIIRLFSVYGPRQRSDMAFNIFIRKLLRNETIQIFGDGSQSRANTFVGDVVDGLIAGMSKTVSGQSYNLCGSEQYNVLQVLNILEEIIGVQSKIEFVGERLGDQQETRSFANKAAREFGFSPKVSLQQGLLRQVEWQRENQN
jgi:UDP-glucuronate 4-epimerase